MQHTKRPPRPVLDINLVSFIEAFDDLNSCRQLGMGFVGNIPYTAILQWVTYWNISQPDRFISVIQSIDRIFVELANKDNTGAEKDDG